MNHLPSVENRSSSETATDANRDSMVSVRGSVIDVYFPKQLPELYRQLQTGDRGEVVIGLFINRYEFGLAI
jgi:hypothetical protein